MEQHNDWVIDRQTDMERPRPSERHRQARTETDRLTHTERHRQIYRWAHGERHRRTD